MSTEYPEYLDDDFFRFVLPRSTDDPVADDYVRMRRAGESHKIAAMLATRTPPSIRTDSTFRHGHCNGNQFEDCPAIGSHHRSVAEAAGVHTAGKIYVSGLARYPGDPMAWVSGRGDIEKVARGRGWGVDGAVNVRRREVEPAPDIPIGEDIVLDTAEDLMAEGYSRDDAIERATQLRSGAIDDYDPGDHVRPIPPEALEYCPDF